MRIPFVQHRILGAVLAAGLTRVLRFADQIILVPLLLAAWGTEQYGEWITLNSLAFFVSIANLGLADAAASDIVLRHSSGDSDGARRTFTTFIILLSLALIGGYAALFGVLQLVGLGGMLSLQVIVGKEASGVVMIVGLAQLLYFYTVPLGGVIGAMRGAAPPALFFGIARAVELVAIAIALMFHAGPLAVALILLGAVVLNVVMSVVGVWRWAPWLRVRMGDFDLHSVRRTWKASLGFFALFVCTALIGVNVPRLVVFHFLGAAAVTTFMVMVTYTRAARMIALALSQSAQIEIGRLFGMGRTDEGKRLIEGVLAAATAAAFVLLLAEVALAPFIIPAWTRGHVVLAWPLFGLLAGVALAGTYFDALMSSAAALNRVALVASGYGLGLIIGLLAGVLLLPMLGLPAMAIGLLCPELVGSLAAMRSLGRAMPDASRLAIPRIAWPPAFPTGGLRK